MTQSSRVEEERPRHAPPETADQEENIGTFHAFRYGNYQLLWVGTLFTSAAQWMQQTALGWVVYYLTGSGQALGGINLIRIIPTLFFSPFAGVVSDRFDRNRIIGTTQLIMFVLTFLVALLLASGRMEIWHLFVFTVLVGSAQTFNMPARQTIVFDVVPRRIVPNAVALNWFAFSVSRAAGPAVGGILIVLMGPAENFFLQAFAYLAVMVTVLLMRLPPRVAQTNRPSFFRQIRAGWAFVFGDRLARTMLLMTTISPLFIIPLHHALLPIFAVKSFDAGADGLGILVGSVGFGGLFGGLLTAYLSNVDRRGLVQLCSLFIFSLSETVFSLLAWTTGNMLIATPFLVLAGIAESFYTTTNTAVLQLLAPERLRGSMAAVLQLSFLCVPIGSMIAGTAADFFGAPAVGAVMTFSAFCVGFSILLFSPEVRNLRMSKLTQAQEAA